MPGSLVLDGCLAQKKLRVCASTMAGERSIYILFGRYFRKERLVKEYKNSIFFVAFLLLAPMIATAGEYSGLTPGVSVKKDVEKEFGSPVNETRSGKCDYSPEGHDLQALSVDFDDDGTVRSIHLLFNQPYAVDKVKEWFDLQGPPDQMDEMMGRRVELYKNKGVQIVFESLDAASDIIQLSHVDASEKRLRPDVKKAALKNVDVCPAAAEKYAQQADPYIKKDQYAEAVAPLKKAAMCDPGRVIYSSMLAFSYWKTDQLDEAIEWAQRTLDIGEDYIAYCVLGSSYWEKKNCDAAVPYLEKAVSFAQDKGNDNLELLGACYYTQGKLNEAVATLTKANKRRHRSPLTTYFLAASFDRLGQTANARSFYKIYLGTRFDNQEMNALARQRVGVLSKEVDSSTREKASQATQMIIRGIFGND